MAEFKLCIADPKAGKTYQKEIKDAEAAPFLGKNIGESVKGDSFGFSGAEFMITGGSDKSGFPMRRGIKGLRKRLNLLGGVGLRKKKGSGTRTRKTVCGHKIGEQITQINVKLTKEGSKKLADLMNPEAPAEEAAPAEENKEAPKAEEKPAEAKEEPKADA